MIGARPLDRIAALALSSGSLLVRCLRPVVNRVLPDATIPVTVLSGGARGCRLVIKAREEKFYWTGVHEPHVQRAIERLVRPGQTFWDVGSHIGFFAVIASRAVGSSGHVRCFEPMDASRVRLHRTVCLNGLTNVEICDVAVSRESGDAVLHPHRLSPMWSLAAAGDGLGGVSVRVRSLDDLAAEARTPDVIKVDVEGAELEVLRGGAQLLRHARPTLLVEFSDQQLLSTARAEFSHYGFEHLGANHWLMVPAVNHDPGCVRSDMGAIRTGGDETLRGATRRLINSRLGQATKPTVASLLGRLGFELVPTRHDDRKHLGDLLQRLTIRSAFDIGANQGQFSHLLRRLGFSGRILSVEPMEAAFRKLERQAEADPRWSVCNLAVASKAGVARLNVAGNSTSSSVLEVNQIHLQAEPTSRTLSTEIVQARTLDEIGAQYRLAPPYFLKIDVQGSEIAVLDGGPNTLAKTSALRIEASLRELYEGAPSISAVLQRIDIEGFVPLGVTTGFQDPRTGDALQVDIVACRREFL
jgi:FkbM family methyltransferase